MGGIGVGVGVGTGRLGKVRSKFRFITGVPANTKTSFSLAGTSAMKNDISVPLNEESLGVTDNNAYLPSVMATGIEVYSPT
ncbi:MAG: hypothetical protein CL694_04425 [Chloroflexi bacterium]|nr:hypothetical protein [Chloroflexota bacterium]